MPEEIRVLSPTAILGYGFPAASLAEGMRRRPDAIAVDAGSTDPGPHFLGLSPAAAGEGLGQFAAAIDADLRPLLKAAVAAGIPLMIGSAGGAGGNVHLMAVALLARRIAAEERLKFRLAVIPAEVDKELIKRELAAGQVAPLGPAPVLTPAVVDRAVRIVAQMGVEPFVAALSRGAQVVIAGRASDPSMFAALPILRGIDPGLALHLGKVLECGAIAAEPGSGGDVMLGTVRRDHFIVEPMNPARRATVQSVAAHSMYESGDPWRLAEPGGVIDLTAVQFAAESDRAVRVSGSRLIKDAVYRVKLEGAELIGYRTVCIAGARDPSVIAHLEEVLDLARQRAAAQFGDPASGGWQLHFRVYGRDGVMGPREPTPTAGHEVGLLIETIAPTQAQASSLCMFVHAAVLHQGFPGRTSTAGNLAFPFSPQDLPAGPVHRFSVYHLMAVADPLALFPIHLNEVGDG
jgi:hypothetical protein